jgi:hypothetical protein
VGVYEGLLQAINMIHHSLGTFAYEHLSERSAKISPETATEEIRNIPKPRLTANIATDDHYPCNQ